MGYTIRQMREREIKVTSYYHNCEMASWKMYPVRKNGKEYMVCPNCGYEREVGH